MIGFTSYGYLSGMNMGHRNVQYFLISHELNETAVSNLVQGNVVNMSSLTPPTNIYSNFQRSGDFEQYINDYGSHLFNNGAFGTLGVMMNIYLNKRKDIIFVCSDSELKLGYCEALGEILKRRYGVFVMNPNELMGAHMSPSNISEYRLSEAGHQYMLSDFEFGTAQIAQAEEQQRQQAPAPTYSQQPMSYGQYREMRPVGYITRADYNAQPTYSNPYNAAPQVAQPVPVKDDGYEMPAFLRKNMVEEQGGEYYIPSAPDPVNMSNNMHTSQYGTVDGSFPTGMTRGLKVRTDGYTPPSQYNPSQGYTPFMQQPQPTGYIQGIPPLQNPQQPQYPVYQSMAGGPNFTNVPAENYVLRPTPPYRRRGKGMNPNNCDKLTVNMLDQ